MIRLRNVDQQRRVRRLVQKACANYDGGNCLLLEDGEVPCPCPQCISCSLLCRWFREAVLPGDTELWAELYEDIVSQKRCVVCKMPFLPQSNRAKYCPACARAVAKQKHRERQRKYQSKP